MAESKFFHRERLSPLDALAGKNVGGNGAHERQHVALPNPKPASYPEGALCQTEGVR